MEKVFLIDGSGILFRAYYAFLTRPLTTSRGEGTSAIFGFLKILIQLLREYRPDRLSIAFDVSRETFRREMYAEYKAHREETPDDLREQIPVLLEILNKMGIAVIQMEKYEADDIIGTLSKKLSAKNDVYIVSGDKDLLQLLGRNVRALRPQKGVSEAVMVEASGVKDILGVEPSQVPDYLAITGDASDNIPGVKGIGDKGARALLAEFSSLEEIYKNVYSIKGAAQKKLLESKDAAFLSKTLATIHCDIDIDVKDAVRRVDPQSMLNADAVKMMEHYEIRSVISDLRKFASLASGTEAEPETDKKAEPAAETGASPDMKGPKEEITDIQGRYNLVLKRAELESLVGRIRESGIFSLDTETTTAVPLEAGLIGISVSIDEGEGSFVPVRYPAGQEFTEEEALGAFRGVLEARNIRKIGQNQKFEWEVFRSRGIALDGMHFDTLIAAYLLNPARTRNNLEALAEEYLRLRKPEYKNVLREHAAAKAAEGDGLFQQSKKEATLLDVPIGVLVNYACSDSDAALRLFHALEPKVAEAGLDNVFRAIEMPLVPVLGGMELAGVRIDAKMLAGLSAELAAGMEEAAGKIASLAGKSFNINSPAQLGKVLFEDLGLEPVKKTEGGKPSTDEEVLTALAAVHPLPAEVLRYRTFSKLKGTYADALPEMVLPETGRVHTSFNQAITATGRLSSSDPNLQNIPVRDEIGRRIRGAFLAAEGFRLVSADYSQIELRVLAHYCGDRALCEAFAENRDIHRRTASLLFDVGEKDVTDEMRRRAKSVNFGIIYGLQAFGLSKQLGISMGEAKEFIRNYFKSFPSVRDFIETTLNAARQSGEVRTLSGRRRSFPDLRGREVKSFEHLNASQRMAVNTVIQGSAADIIKMAMVRVHEKLKEESLKTRMILQIHDELVLEAPEAELEKAKSLLRTAMEGAYSLAVPLVADVGDGTTWSDAH